MAEFMERIKGLIRDEEGATATEYAVMLALIIAVAILTVVFLGEKVEEGFNKVATKLDEKIGN